MDPSPAVIPPGNAVTRHLVEQLKRHPKRVVFTEGEDIRVLRTAARHVEMETIVPILLGDRDRIHALAAQNGIPMKFIKVLDPPHASDFNLFCQRVANMARYRKVQSGNPAEIVARPHYFGSLMVQYGQADALVAGNKAQPATFYRALLNAIKPLPDVPKIFATTILIGPHLKHLGGDGILFLADCGIIPNPDVEQLASIAVETGKLAHHFLGRTPLVAMLSHSTKGSASTPDARRVAAAAALAREKISNEFLDIEVEGEIQADVALDPEAAETKIPGAERRHTADVLVFPSLDAAHIALKLLKHVAGAMPYGQLILGLARPAALVPNTTSEETLFGTAAAVAVEAIKYHQLYPHGDYHPSESNDYQEQI
jgi:phosphate acetyltransferase